MSARCLTDPASGRLTVLGTRRMGSLSRGANPGTDSEFPANGAGNSCQSRVCGSNPPAPPTPLARNLRQYATMKLPVLFTLAAATLAAAGFPDAEISNGSVRAKLYLPDARQGYYRATRFDWSGQI